MKHKKMFAMLMVFFILVSSSLSACVAKTQPRLLHTSWSSHFDSVEEMYDASDLIIRGIVIDSNIEKRRNLELTHNTIRVTEVISGEIKVNELIDLVQTGSKTFGAPDELPLLEKSEEYLLFLEHTDPDPRYGQYYMVMGGYQGIAQQDGTTLVPLADENPKFVDAFSRVMNGK